jgi:magnesium transporter
VTLAKGQAFGLGPSTYCLSWGNRRPPSSAMRCATRSSWQCHTYNRAVIRYFVHRAGQTEPVDTIDPAWLEPSSGVYVWADLQEPAEPEARVLREVFGFHDLSVDHALQESQHPKIESYGRYLYLVLHGINFQPEQHTFDTHDTDFFLGPNYLVTVHDGKRRTIQEVLQLCLRSNFVLADGPIALFHRIIDTMVEHYRPELDELEERLDYIEARVLEETSADLTGEILAVKRDISALRRIVIPQRDAVGRLARREFDLIDQEMAYRFRDVYDQFVHMADEAILFQDRVTGILDAHLASVSNRLALVSKVLAAMAVIFGPLTVFTGLFGMNVTLPAFPGGETAQFWWVLGVMAAITAGLWAVFKRSGWL